MITIKSSALTVALAAALISPIAADAASLTTLYAFGNNGGSLDAGGPGTTGQLMADGNVLYGLTFGGGVNGYGALYSVNIQTHAETVVHSFSANEQYPNGAVIKVNYLGNNYLYGTAEMGGTHASGTVYRVPLGACAISCPGAASTVYSFPGGTMGSWPAGPMLQVGQFLYGVTNPDYTNPNGTVYKFKLAGNTQAPGAPFVLLGNNPHATGPLIKVGNYFYGLTINGGQGGYLFAIDGVGHFTVAHEFGLTGDGKWPSDALTPVTFGTHTFLYGTTSQGGQNGKGTIFRVEITGGCISNCPESVVHEFAGGPDVEFPQSGLARLGAYLYGVAPNGGGGGPQPEYGKGAIYRTQVSLACGTNCPESVVHAFPAAAGEGVLPFGALLAHNQKLYGTTGSGGPNNAGTVFAFTP